MSKLMKKLIGKNVNVRIGGTKYNKEATATIKDADDSFLKLEDDNGDVSYVSYSLIKEVELL